MNKKKVSQGRLLRTVRVLANSLDPTRIIAQNYIHRLNKAEHRNPPFTNFNERPIEYRFVFEQISQYYPKTILDVGTGLTALPHVMANCGCKVTAIDNIKDYWKGGIFNRHFLVKDDSIVRPREKGAFDMITCISTLEHIEEFDQAIHSMFSLLKKDGLLVLTFPYTEKTYIENVYEMAGTNAPQLPGFKTHSFSRKEIDRWVRDNNAAIIKQEYWQFFTGECWTVGQWLATPRQVSERDLHQISCILLTKEGD